MAAHVQDGRPRGLQSVPDRARAAFRMAEEGATRAEIAKAFGVSPAAVHQWMAMVRNAEKDAESIAANGRRW